MAFVIKTDDKGTKVFRKDREWSGGSFATYSTSVSSKDKAGNYVNAYVDLKFKKGVELNNKSVIKINNAFPVVDEYKEQKKISYFVTEFDIIEGGESAAPVDNDSWANIDTDDSLPFAPPTRG